MTKTPWEREIRDPLFWLTAFGAGIFMGTLILALAGAAA